MYNESTSNYRKSNLKLFFHNWKLGLNPCTKLAILFSLNVRERNIKEEISNTEILYQHKVIYAFFQIYVLSIL